MTVVHTLPALSPRRRRFGPIFTNSLLVVLWGFFAAAHVARWLTTGHPTGLVLAIQESVLIVLFLVRRTARSVSGRPSDWLAAVLGTFAVLLLRPTGSASGALEATGAAIQAAGAAWCISGSVALGRSFGLVAANRGVKTSGLYRVVRHPLYAGYVVGEIGYLVAAFSLRNAMIIVVANLFQLWRIAAEERVLFQDAEYRAYAHTVRYRLVPGLF